MGLSIEHVGSAATSSVLQLHPDHANNANIRQLIGEGVTTLGHYFRFNGQMDDNDILFMREVMIHLNYVDLILSKIEKEPDVDHSYYDLDQHMLVLSDLLMQMVGDPTYAMVTDAHLCDINSVLEEMINAYYYPPEPVKPSLIEVMVARFNNALTKVTGYLGDMVSKISFGNNQPQVSAVDLIKRRHLNA